MDTGPETRIIPPIRSPEELIEEVILLHNDLIRLNAPEAVIDRIARVLHAVLPDGAELLYAPEDPLELDRSLN